MRTCLQRYNPGTGRHRRSRRSPGPTLILWFGMVTCSAFALAQPPPDYSRDPEWFPRFYKPYLQQEVPAFEPPGDGAARRIRDGRLNLSLPQLLDLVAQNNLDVAVARYASSVAQTDVLRAKAGQAPRGIEGAPIPSGLFAGAIGAGLGQAGGTGGIGGGGGITGQARAVSLFPRGTFDPTLVLNFSWNRSTDPLNTIRVAGVPVVTTSTIALQTSYQQAFTSGTTFNFSFSGQRQRSTQRSLLFNPSVASRYTLSVTQNLLSGFGFSVNRRFLEVARTNQRIARELFRQRIIEVLTEARNQYWNLVTARENVRNAEQALAAARRLHEDNRRRVEIGTMAPVDLIAVQAEVAARQRDLVVAQTEFQIRELALKSLFSKEMEPELAAAKIEVTDPLPVPEESDIPDPRVALAEALENRPELRQARENIGKQQVVVRFTTDSLRPRLTAFVLLASSGLAGNRLLPDPAGGPAVTVPGGLAQTLGQVAGLDFPEYAVGLNLSIPIKNRSAQADDVRARFEEQQAHTTLQRTQAQVGLEVRRAIISLQQSKARVEAARKSVNLARQVLDAEETKLRAGVSAPYDVIRLQRDWVAAQRAEVEAGANYAKALVEMERATGTSLEKTKIDLDALVNSLR
ncbi:MAG: TolC family protein [Acidobacteria bacterium]|nr:TolC family protein [Acidobacteriota bacterium]